MGPSWNQIAIFFLLHARFIAWDPNKHLKNSPEKQYWLYTQTYGKNMENNKQERKLLRIFEIKLF